MLTLAHVSNKTGSSVTLIKTHRHSPSGKEIGQRLFGRVLGWPRGVEIPLLTLLVGIWVLPTSCRVRPLPVVSSGVESLMVVLSLVFVGPF